jgi:hypothetical protein
MASAQKPRQVASLGRLDKAVESGLLVRLLFSGERLIDKLVTRSEASQKDLSRAEQNDLNFICF